MNLGMICNVIGHKVFNTYSIEAIEDSFDVSDAKYCERCGGICQQAKKPH